VKNINRIKKFACPRFTYSLEEFGSSLDRVVKCTVMLADINEWQEMNAVYVTFFPKHLPARSAFGTSGLAMGARLEIECWATVD
jgi:enamine deaminase RidA (YjgF/YER057c/UK114 family)